VPTINPVQSAEVKAAISRAAERTGVDFDYLLAQAKLESNLDPEAKAKTSTATGLYQFIESTWLRTVDQHGDKHGLDWADAAINAYGRVSDPATRAELLSLRKDAGISSMMAAELARDNAASLRSSLNREPEPVELYLAHFLGLGGAKNFLGALGSNPEQSAVALLPQAAKANRAIFYNGSTPRTVGEVMSVMRGKVDAAYDDLPAPKAEPSPIARIAESAPQPATRPDPISPRTYRQTGPSLSGFVPPDFGPVRSSQPSMAETLHNTFGSGDPNSSGASQHIAAAYNKFRAFGL
jgi:hypothetical protein